MSKFKDKAAHESMMKARTRLVVSQPFYGCLSLQLKLVEVTEEMQGMFGGRIETMAVDGRHLYYWPPFVHSLSEDECLAVVAHEVTHCAYQHMTRRGSRDHLIWNYAGDYVINSDLKKAGFNLPTPHLYDPKYEGWSTDEIYDDIYRNAKKLNIQIQQPGSAKGGQGQGQGQQQGNGRGGGMDPGRMGAVLDADHQQKQQGDSEGARAEQDRIGRQWEGNVRMAINVAVRQAGKLPGNLERLVNALKEPTVDWRAQLHQFVDGAMGCDYSWMRPNRRFVSQGVYLPGYAPDSLRQLIMGIDVSGSITDELMRAMVSEGAGALDGGVCDELVVVYIDDGLPRQIDTFNKGDLVEAKTMGGGGTDFTKSMAYLAEHYPDASAMVFLTDMMTLGWGEEPPFPVLWGAYLPKNLLAQVTPPFGSVLHVEGP